MLAGGQALARRFGTDQIHFGIVEEGVEHADGIGAAADAGDHCIRKAPVLCQHLGPRFGADHRVEIAHHARIRTRTGGSTDDVEGVLDVGHPITHGFVQGVFQGFRTRGDRHHLGAQQFHAEHVDGLALDIDRTHVNHAFQAQTRGHGGRGHAVLSGTGFGDNPGLAHALGQHGLTDGVVDLVRAGMVQVLALEQDARAADMLAQAFGLVNRARTTHVMGIIEGQLGLEGRISLGRIIGLFQLSQRRHQGFGHKSAAVNAEVAVSIGVLGIIEGSVGLGIHRLLLSFIRMCSADEIPHFHGIFDARRRFNPARHIHRIRLHGGNGFSHIFRCKAAGQVNRFIQFRQIGPGEAFALPTHLARRVAIEHERLRARVIFLAQADITSPFTHRHCLDERHSELRTERIGFIAMELQQTRLQRLDDHSHGVGIRVHEQGDQIDMRRHRSANRRHRFQRHMTLAARHMHHADGIYTEGCRQRGIFSTGKAAEFDAHAHFSVTVSGRPHSGGYRAPRNIRPSAGAVGPATVRSRPSSRVFIQSTGCSPLPINNRLPTRLRTM